MRDVPLVQRDDTPVTTAMGREERVETTGTFHEVRRHLRDMRRHLPGAGA